MKYVSWCDEDVREIYRVERDDDGNLVVTQDDARLVLSPSDAELLGRNLLVMARDESERAHSLRHN